MRGASAALGSGREHGPKVTKRLGGVGFGGFAFCEKSLCCVVSLFLFNRFFWL